MSNTCIYNNTYIQQIQSISLPNKYTNWYCQLVLRAQTRATSKKQAELICKTRIEKHHILPKSFNLGGETDKLNYAFLTTREHFICHWLLTKAMSSKFKAKMVHALNGMRRNNHYQDRYCTKITAKVYERIKNESAKIRSEEMKGIPNIKASIALKGRPSGKKGIPKPPRTAEHSLNISKALTGRASRLKGIPSGKKGIPNPKISEAHKGKSKPPRTAEHSLNISNALKARFSK